MKNDLRKSVIVSNSEVEIYANDFKHAKSISKEGDILILRVSEIGPIGEIIDSIKDTIIGDASTVEMQDYWSTYSEAI